MDTIKVILVDDHQIIIDGLKSLLANQNDIEVVGEASNGKEAIDLTNLVDPQVILMDIDMPVLNGIEATKMIKKKSNLPKIIILSMHNETSLIKNMINSGADGYLLKNCDHSELTEAIRRVAAGKKFFSADITLSMMDKKTQGTAYKHDSRLADLTQREIEILKLIAEGYSNKEIGDKLYISHRTVDTHRTNLMKKLEVNNIAGLIRFAINNGFIS